MCRWMAWTGQPMMIDELLFKPKHGLIDQSLHAEMGVETTNGDGYGLAWYGTGDRPCVYRSIAPAWGDANLRELAQHIITPLFLAHVRATTGTAIQQNNCHPFRHDRWLFVHNGVIEGFEQIKRELLLAVDPALFVHIEGSTDSEILFYLALTFGLEDDPVQGLERAIGFVEQVADRNGIANAVQASIGVSDGEDLWAVRYSTERASRTLFTSTDARTLRVICAAHPEVQNLCDQDHLIVSEPINPLPGGWHEVPESSVVLIRDGESHSLAFHPDLDWRPVSAGDAA
jgi:predicted glutamine amidotransferase